MKTRLLALAVAVLLIGVGCADVTGSAVEVNGDAIPRSDVVDAIGDLRLGTEPDRPASVECQLGNDVVSLLITNEVLEQELSRLGASVSDAHLDVARTAAEPLVSGDNAQFTPDAEPVVVRTLALREAMKEVAGIDEQQLLGELVPTLRAEADISIDPRFGSWVNGAGFISRCLG